MAERDLVNAGIDGLDSILSGGIPRGNLVLLEGVIGSGKTTLGLEFVYRQHHRHRSFRLGMTVAKMRANPNQRATHECEILAGQGMRVLPRQIPAPMVRPFSSYLNLISRNPPRNPDPSVEPART